MRKSQFIATVLMSAFMLVGVFSCAGKDINENDPAALFKEVEEDIASDSYLTALDKLKTIRNKFPYSKYAVDAQLRIADVYFLQESYTEAAQMYESFRDLHPKHERMPYAMYRIGLSYFKDMPTNISRDLSGASKALDAFNAFLLRYPSAQEAPEARKHVVEIRTALAEKELYIGNFYFKRSQYDSARSRYRKIIDNYPETDAAKTARERLDRIAKELHNSGNNEEPSVNDRAS